MHSLQRLIPGLLGLALAVSPSTGAVAHEPEAPAPHSHHDHKGLLGRKNCVECQRARAFTRDGVNVPPPPSAVPQGAVVPHGAAVQYAPDVAIQHIGHDAHDGHIHAEGGIIIEEGTPIVLEDGHAHPPGRAVVGGGSTDLASMPPGRAVSGGPEPAPVGVSSVAGDNSAPSGNVAAAPRRDSSFTPTSIPPAQTAIGGATSSRPRIISHLLGLPDLRRLRKDRQAYLAREGHASIPYGDQSAPVTDLPASMVYGDDR